MINIKSVQLMTLDILEYILLYAENPSRLGEYLSQKLKELVGCRIVLLIQYEKENKHRIISICPERYGNILKSEDIEHLAYLTRFIDKSEIIGHEKCMNSQNISSLVSEKSMAIPLNIGSIRVGILFLLDLFDVHRCEEVMAVFDGLSTIIALILRNSFLYEFQELIIEERTSELRMRENELRYRLEMEELAAGISNRFINIPNEDIDHEITVSLKIIGEFLDIDRCHMNLVSDDMKKIVHVYEWVRDGRSTVEDVKSIIGENASWIIDKFNNLEIVSVSSVKEMGDEAKYEREIWLSLGIKSIVCIPFKFGEKGFGFLGLNGERMEKKWKKEDLSFFRMIGEIFVNVLERKRVEDERKRFEEYLRQSHKMEAIATMSGGLSHDFNNILGSIMGYAELALDEVTEHSDAHNYLSSILSSSVRAKNLIKQFLLLSHQKDWTKITGEPAGIIEEVLYSIKATLPSNISLCHNIDRRGIIMLDSTSIHQILFNLCSNSVYAMRKKGGVLTVNLSYVSSEQSFLYGDIGRRNYMRLMVSDTGCGMEPRIMERIFEPYFTTKKLGEASGMGLPVVYGIVKKYGGEIRVESEPGKGTEFNIFLPVEKY